MIRKVTFVLILAAAVALGSRTFAAIDPVEAMDENIVVAANIVLTFVAPVDPSRSSVEVFGSAGKVPVGLLRQGSDSEDLLIPLGHSLPPGTYSVEFEAIAIDGTKMFGSTSVIISPGPNAPSPTDLLGAK